MGHEWGCNKFRKRDIKWNGGDHPKIIIRGICKIILVGAKFGWRSEKKIYSNLHNTRIIYLRELHVFQSNMRTV